MHETHYINGSSVAKQCYKMYCVNKDKKSCKKCMTMISSRNTLIIQKKTWDILRTLLPNKSSFNNPTSSTVNNTTFTDPRAITEEFNNHFDNIGKHSANSVNKVNHDNFCAYLKNTYPFSISTAFNSTRNLHAH